MRLAPAVPAMPRASARTTSRGSRCCCSCGRRVGLNDYVGRATARRPRSRIEPGGSVAGLATAVPHARRSAPAATRPEALRHIELCCMQRLAQRSLRRAAIDVSVGCSANNYSSVSAGRRSARAAARVGHSTRGRRCGRRESEGADPTILWTRAGDSTFSSDHRGAGAPVIWNRCPGGPAGGMSAVFEHATGMSGQAPHTVIARARSRSPLAAPKGQRRAK